MPWASRARAVRERSAPAVQTGEQGPKTPRREKTPQPSHPSSHLPLGSRLPPTPHLIPPSLLACHLPVVASRQYHTLPSPCFPNFFLSCPVSVLFSPCRNRATCQDSPQGPRCLCPTGYTGGSCQVRAIEVRHAEEGSGWEGNQGGSPGPRPFRRGFLK